MNPAQEVSEVRKTSGHFPMFQGTRNRRSRTSNTKTLIPREFAHVAWNQIDRDVTGIPSDNILMYSKLSSPLLAFESLSERPGFVTRWFQSAPCGIRRLNSNHSAFETCAEQTSRVIWRHLASRTEFGSTGGLHSNQMAGLRRSSRPRRQPKSRWKTAGRKNQFPRTETIQGLFD